MDSPAITISGGSPIFHGSVTVNVNIGHVAPEARPTRLNAQKSTAEDKTDDLEVKLSTERDFHDHRGDERIYQITRHPKGRVLIINNEFRGDRAERRGSNKDRHDMIDLWDKMGCDVSQERDLTATKLLNAVTSFAASTLEADFYVLIIMSHGTEDDLLIGSDRGKLAVGNLVNAMMENERLAGKPKLIFFQMCRGSKVRRDQADAEAYDTSDSTWIMSLLHDVLPNGRILGSSIDDADEGRLAGDYIYRNQDVLLTFATQPHHMAFLNQARGSWFIQAIKRVFAKHAATLDVVQMMTEVKKEVSQNTAYAPESDHDKGKEEVDASCTFGGKRLMLFPGFPSPLSDNGNKRRKLN